MPSVVTYTTHSPVIMSRTKVATSLADKATILNDHFILTFSSLDQPEPLPSSLDNMSVLDAVDCFPDELFHLLATI